MQNKVKNSTKET